ncbi:Bromodomain-containing protein [Syncephalastrum racemosum]|uniref:Bromodomain-containing protein n=1 Tax=Syncephalastrum racemosum TaxID=13706 RepID=A0A1X2HT19_SYNRA|nr:Bromodomain-containing protein [Syncephalastrum racemosum]
MTRDQIKYSGAIMRNLRRHRDANPFLHPVDYVKMNLPDYPKIIQHPMDLGTVEAKLNNLEYENIEDFIADVRLVFSNCFKFNGPEAMISMLCQNVETAFEKSLRQMPSSTDGEPKTTNARPKRDKHPPPSKDYPEPATKRRSNVRQSNAQMRFCGQVLRELRKPKYRDISYPFLQPVDVVALNIPDYLEVIKHPMDLSTMERKLDEGDYQTPDDFERDMRLMFQNCYTYNPPGSPVHEMGKRLESEFDKKWSEMPEPVPPEVQSPPPAPPAPQPKRRRTKSDVFEEQEHSEDETRDEDDPIAVMERHIANMSRQLESLRSSKKKKQAKPPQVQPRKPAPKRRRPPAKPPVEEYPDFTLEQKQLLSERINNLTDDRLHHVVGIIQKSMPDLGGDEQEIELDMDNLDKRTLHKLHEYVMGTSLVRRPSTKKAKPAPKRAKTETKPVEKFQDKSSSESDTGSSSSGSSDDSSSSSSDEM